MLNFNLISFGVKTLDACQIHALSGRREMRPSKIRTNSDTVEPLTNHICHKSPSVQSSLALSHMRGSFKPLAVTEQVFKPFGWFVWLVRALNKRQKFSVLMIYSHRPLDLLGMDCPEPSQKQLLPWLSFLFRHFLLFFLTSTIFILRLI